MRLRLKAGLLAGAIVMACVAPAFAASVDEQKSVTAVEEAPVVTVVGDPYVWDKAQNAVNPGDPVGSCSDTVEDMPQTRAVSISKDITVTIGKSWDTTFNTGKIFVDDHNAFNVIVSDVSGSKYKILVENDNGWTYESSECSGECTVTITNVLGSDDYTVYVLNTGTGTLSAHVKISSYYYYKV